MRTGIAQVLWAAGVPLTGSAAQNALLAYASVAVAVAVVLVVIVRRH